MELRSVIENVCAITCQQETLKNKSRHVLLKKASAYPDKSYPTPTYTSTLPDSRKFSSYTFRLGLIYLLARLLYSGRVTREIKEEMARKANQENAIQRSVGQSLTVVL